MNSSLAEYSVDKVPLDIALNLNSSKEECTCGAVIQLKYGEAPRNVRMRVCLKEKTNEDYDNLL